MDPRHFVIQVDSKFFACVVCGCDMTDYEDAYRHLHGSGHTAAVEKYGRGLSYEFDNTYYCRFCPCWIFGYQNVPQHIRGIMHEALLEISDSESSYADSEEEKPDLTEAKPDSHSFIIEYDDSEYQCILCNVCSYGKSFVKEHVATAEHIEAVQTHGSHIVVGCYGSCDCSLCECFISGYSNVYGHITGYRHRTSLEEKGCVSIFEQAEF